MRLNPPSSESAARLSLAAALLTLLWSVLARLRSETWGWVATLNLLPPQLLLPLIAWLMWRTRRSVWLLFNTAFAALFVVFQVGLIVPVGAAAALPAASTVSALTLNAQYASASPEQLAQVAAREGADVITLQEAENRRGDGSAYVERLRSAFPGWALGRDGELVTLTRLPLQSSRLVHFGNPDHGVLVTRLKAQGQVLTVINAHLPTLALRPTQGEPDTVFARVAARLAERRALPDAVQGIIGGAPGAVVLAGDINAPTHGQMHGSAAPHRSERRFCSGGPGLRLYLPPALRVCPPGLCLGPRRDVWARRGAPGRTQRPPRPAGALQLEVALSARPPRRAPRLVGAAQ